MWAFEGCIVYVCDYDNTPCFRNKMKATASIHKVTPSDITIFYIYIGFTFIKVVHVYQVEHVHR